MAQPDNVVRLRAALAKIETDAPERAAEIRKAALDFAIKYASRKGRCNAQFAVQCAAAFAAFLADGSVEDAPSLGV